MNSFDVFDTLIARRWIDNRRVLESIALDQNFVEQRIAADNGQRNLYEIYEAMGHDNFDQMRLEIDAEIANSFPIAENMDRVKDGDILISDMYLPAFAIMQMVRACGLKKQVTLYQSNAGKASGSVWKQIRPSLHLGDNKHSDYDMALQNGVNAEHYLGTAFNENELLYVGAGLQHLAYLIREIRLSNSKIEHLDYFDLSNAHNLPFLFTFCEKIHREYAGRDVVFLGRDCFLLEKIYSRYYEQSSYVPFSRKLAFNTPFKAIEYLVSQSPANPVFVDLSSTGATWEELSLAGFDPEVFIGIYSDQFHYTKEKPVLPRNFKYFTKNSDIGKTDTMLEIMNCADHGVISSVQKFGNFLLAGKFEKSEMPTLWAADIHKPIYEAVRLVEHYDRFIKEDLSQIPDDKLAILFGRCATYISNKTDLASQIHGLEAYEKSYMESL
jgi:hypothetical protein